MNLTPSLKWFAPLAASIAAAACSSASSPGRETPASNSNEIVQVRAQAQNDAVAYLAATDPSMKDARLVDEGDFKTEYEREWMRKMGYSAALADDFENDGKRENAVAVRAGGVCKVIILRRDNEEWKKLHSEDTPGPVMIRSEFLGGGGGTKCILVASGQQGSRFGICWDGKGFTRITL
jgi:hypothetical protein